MNILEIENLDIQEVVELAAGLNSILDSNFLGLLNGLIRQRLDADQKHYLFLYNPTDLADWVWCGTAKEAVRFMKQRGQAYRLYDVPADECPGCNEDEEEAD